MNWRGLLLAIGVGLVVWSILILAGIKAYELLQL